MSKKNLVSIIIPTYNHEKFIEESIESALDQTYKDVEVIVIDAGSTDSTIKIINKKFLKFIKFFKLKNSDPSSTINYGIQKSSGEFIALSSGDDINHNNRIQSQLEFLHKYKSEIIFSSQNQINEKGKKILQRLFTQKFIDDNDDNFLFLFNFGNYLCAPSAFVDKKVFNKIGLFNPLFLQLQDYEFWMRALLKNIKINYINSKLISYRIHKDNLSKKQNNERMENEIPLVLFEVLSTESNKFKKIFINYFTFNEIDKIKKQLTHDQIQQILSNHPIKKVRSFSKWIFFNYIRTQNINLINNDDFNVAKYINSFD